MVFTVSTRHYLGDHATIVTHTAKGQEIPVMHIFSGEVDFPEDTKKLATNLASLMNGNKPPFRFDLSKELYWRETDKGFEFRIKEKDGLTRGGPVAALAPGQEDKKDLVLTAARQQCQAADPAAPQPFTPQRNTARKSRP